MLANRHRAEDNGCTRERQQGAADTGSDRDLREAFLLKGEGGEQRVQEVCLKTIGLIGGMSWQSTIPYYRIINEAVQARLGGLHSAKLLLGSVDFQPLEAMQRAGDWAAAGQLLAQAGRSLEAAGADFLVLCTNTMHRVADVIEAALEVPFLHLADATAQAANAQGVQRVGLLGTRYTMEHDFYRGRLEAHGLDVIVPDEADRGVVHAVIYDELVRGITTAESKAAYLAIIDRLVGRGAQGVIAGCTEIELLVGSHDVAVPYFATTRLHAEAAVRFAVGSSGEGAI